MAISNQVLQVSGIFEIVLTILACNASDVNLQSRKPGLGDARVKALTGLSLFGVSIWPA